MSSKFDLRNYNIKSHNLKSLDLITLRREYLQLVDELNFKYLRIKNRTIFEFKFADQIKNKTQLNVEHSVWIGSYCYDFFIPALSLAIEIDGPIHDVEFKGKLDMSKVDQSRLLGIIVSSISNLDLKHPCVLNILDQLPKLQRRDSRGRQRLLRNVYIMTILSHRGIPEIRERMGDSVAEIFSSLRKIK